MIHFPAETTEERQRKKEEWRTWLFFTVFLAPLLAVLVVSGWGFLVWMYQAFIAGPPTY
ncbi:MAG TPA: periplasmic nitrate reductase, NapE protein [Burkholderiales bacterium]|nr:periplasmic nitrate reductase, NapE protein [Burkholderiales bacterium]